MKLSPLVLSALGGLGAVLALFAFQSRSRTPVTASGPADEALAGHLAELARAQERTAAALERLEDLLEAPVRAGEEPAVRRPSIKEGGELPRFDELIASLDALRASFEAESQRTQELIRSAPALGGESLSQLKQRSTVTNWSALDLLEDSWREDSEKASRSQYLQSAQDLVASYGVPSSIYRPKRGGLLFVYRRHEEGQAGPAWYYHVQDGMVVEFFLEDEEAEEAEE